MEGRLRKRIKRKGPHKKRKRSGHLNKKRQTEVQIGKKWATRNHRQRGRIGSRPRRKTEERHAKGRRVGVMKEARIRYAKEERGFQWKVDGRHERARQTVSDEGRVHEREGNER